MLYSWQSPIRRGGGTSGQREEKSVDCCIFVAKILNIHAQHWYASPIINIDDKRYEVAVWYLSYYQYWWQKEIVCGEIWANTQQSTICHTTKYILIVVYVAKRCSSLIINIDDRRNKEPLLSSLLMMEGNVQRSRIPINFLLGLFGGEESLFSHLPSSFIGP